jgi:hypothetical protein
LPWDQIGYWAVKIVTGVPEAIPVIGSPLVELLERLARRCRAINCRPVIVTKVIDVFTKF